MVQSAVHWLLWSDMRVLLRISQLALLQHSLFVVQTTTANASRIIRQNTTTTTLFPSGCLYLWPFRLYSHHHRHHHHHLTSLCPISIRQKSRENETETEETLMSWSAPAVASNPEGLWKSSDSTGWEPCQAICTVPPFMLPPPRPLFPLPAAHFFLLIFLRLSFCFLFLKQKIFFEIKPFFLAQSRNLVHNVSLAATFNRSLWSSLLFFFRCPPNSQVPLPLFYYYFPLPKLDETLIYFWICRTNFIL